MCTLCIIVNIEAHKVRQYMTVSAAVQKNVAEQGYAILNAPLRCGNWGEE